MDGFVYFVHVTVKNGALMICYRLSVDAKNPPLKFHGTPTACPMYAHEQSNDNQ